MAMRSVVPTYTVDDLESFPNDGNRYELLEGMLLVTPAPMPPHELVVQRVRDELIVYLGRRARVFTRGAVLVTRRSPCCGDRTTKESRSPTGWSGTRER